MDIYRFDPPSHVDEISVVTTDNGAKRAYVKAPATTSAEMLDDIKEKFTLSGWQAIPSIFEGKPVLEVRGFGKEQKLFDTLKQHSFCEGTPAKTSINKLTPSWWEMIKKRSLQASGAFYLLGDLAYTMYGYKEAHKEDMIAGGLYFAGTGTLLAFGNNDQAELQIKDLSEDMVKHLASHSISAPESCSLRAITQQQNRGGIKKAEELFRRYPSEIMNTCFSLAGLFIATSAMRHRVLTMPEHAGASVFKHKLEGVMDVGLGAMNTVGGTIATLVKEKAKDPDEPEHKGTAGLWDWVQEKPLRVAGYSYIASTMCHAASTTLALFEARKHNDKKRLASVPYRAAFVGSALIAEFLMSISSKGHGEGVTSDESVKDSMYAIAAELILKQPANIQEAQLRHMVNFLEHPTVLAEKRDVVEQKLRENMAQLQSNPWLCMNIPQKETDTGVIGTLSGEHVNRLKKSDDSKKVGVRSAA